MVKKIIIFLIIGFGAFFLAHNFYYYPVIAGYDASFHLNYADILTSQWRFPSLDETREAYNPPFFYLISGLVGRFVSNLTGLNFFSALKVWQYISLIFVFLMIYFWYQILRPLLPKTKLAHLAFVIFLFSLPVFQKTIVMFNLELFSAFLMSLGFWYFIVHFQFKPTILKTIILAIITILNLLTRLSSLTLLITLIAGFVGLGFMKKIDTRQLIKLISVFLALIVLSCSWFYLGRANQDIYGVGEGGEPNIPFFQRQPLAFYTEIPFRLMMSYPIRFAPNTPLNRLIPIYYSEFWGDWWNYFSQRRFGIPLKSIRKDHYLTSQARVNNLALQNRINLPVTLLIIVGFIYLLSKTLIQSFRKVDANWLTSAMMLLLTILTYFGWLVMITKFPGWKGDSIKASYMLNILPVLAFSVINFLPKILKKTPVFFTPVLIWLIIATGINLWWGWY